MKQGSTLFLKAAIILIGLIVLTLCVYVLPSGITSDKSGDYRPILFGMYITAVPFFIALYQGYKLLTYVDKKEAFSHASIQALKYVKYCASIIGVLYSLGMPYIYYVAEGDDAPGVVALGLIIVGASFFIAAAAALLQSLVQNAVDIKSENDLTV
jgi:hypothetical protein